MAGGRGRPLGAVRLGKAPPRHPGRPRRSTASGPLAQLVEHLTFNQVVTGSIPVRPTINSLQNIELATAGKPTSAQSQNFRTIFANRLRHGVLLFRLASRARAINRSLSRRKPGGIFQAVIQRGLNDGV